MPAPNVTLQESATDLSLFVMTSDEEIQKWDRPQIVRVLMDEAGAPQALAEEVAAEVENTLVSAKIRNTSTTLIRELVNAKLVEKGYKDYALLHSRFGLPAKDIEKIVYTPTNENANVLFTAESIHKYIADAVTKQYTLEYLLPVKYKKPYLSRAHMSGDIHIHDLDYFITRPYCAGHDLRYLAKYGLVMDGTGRSAATAKPARAPEVLLLHAAKFLGVSQSAFSGAQAYSIFNPIVAPYLVGKSDQEIAQLAQMFIFEMAQMAVARGAQVVFSDLNLDFGIPHIIEDVPAIGPKGKITGVYGDYWDESNKFAHALLDVYGEGDSRGVPFMFPKPLIKVRKEHIGDPEFEEFMLHAAQVSATKGNPYYINQVTYEDECISMCCRLRHKLKPEDGDDIREGRMRSSAIQNNTVNMPRLAYKAKGNDDKLFEELHNVMQLCREVHQIKRVVTQALLDAGGAPLLTMKMDGLPYLRMEKVRHLIGVLGLNEMVQIHTGQQLHESNEALQFGWKVIREMENTCKEFTQEDGVPYALEQTPAETTAYRFAKLDLKQWDGLAAQYVKGDINSGGVYYTNSTYLNVGIEMPAAERIKKEGLFHPIIEAGALTHVWLGESSPDPEALKNFTIKMMKNTMNQQITYTRDLTYCKGCGKLMGGIFDDCPNCGMHRMTGWKRAEVN
jgi:ribonucleoside-triphosphate reductase